MSPGHRVFPCRGCGLHFDPLFLQDGLCLDCEAEAYRRNVLAERD